ncbi:MAG: amidohydrolase [Pseudomonadales bacterium]|jgi:predicted amidohydrolase|nr:amidohydrolase [Pseudomonadales bacterium]
MTTSTDTLRLTLVQSDLVWQDAASNRALLEAQISPLAGATDLVLLPEMFTSAFVVGKGAVAETHPGPTLEWMQRMARELGAALAGSVAVRVDGAQFNRLLFVTPEGGLWHYDKRHLFRMLGEHERYAAGKDKLLLTWRGWRLFPMVCYDLRFPVWCRNTADEPYDLMLCVANWPAPRSEHWSALLKARAIENLAFVAGVNRVGRDGNDLDYAGQSVVHDPRGETLVHAGDRATLAHAELRRDSLTQWRERFPAWMDADHFQLLD